MVIKQFEYFEHTADIKFRSYGESLEELFTNAVLALFNVMVDIDKVQSIEGYRLEISAKSIEQLLYDFLQELVVLVDSDGYFYFDVDEIKIVEQDDGSYKLFADVFGDECKFYDTKEHVKNMTYSQMEIGMLLDDKTYYAQVVLDV